jgi:hypothetical protein
MTGIPAWIHNDSVVITRTMNGFAIVETPTSPVSQSVSFETWDALAYYLNANFSPAA